MNGAGKDSGRSRMLAAIRAGVARRKEPAPEKPAPIVPRRGQQSGPALADLFRRQLLAAKATLTEVKSAADVPAAIAQYLRDNNLEARLRLSPDSRVTDLPWAGQPLLEISTGASDGAHPVSVTPAVAGVAETGTLVLQSSARTPVSLHFLPETHIVVLRRGEILGTYEEALAKVTRSADGSLPRSVNFVTGPSRSADIGKILLMGAHGPKRLHVVVVGA